MNTSDPSNNSTADDDNNKNNSNNSHATVATSITTLEDHDGGTAYSLFESTENSHPVELHPPVNTSSVPLVALKDDPVDPFHPQPSNAHTPPHHMRQHSDDMSLATQKTFSTTDGVDIVFGSSPPPTNVLEWHQTFAGRIVRDKRFKRLVIVMIILNSLVLGLSTFYFVNSSHHRHVAILLDTLDTGFLILFTMELFLQVVYYSAGGWQHVLRQGWLLTDILIVGASLLCNTLLVLRAFRIIRTLRLATRVEELRVLALTLLKVIPKMLALVTMMLLLFYIFAVIFTNLFYDLYDEGQTSEDYFSRLDITAFTLFTMMTLDGWSNIAREVMAVHGWAWIFFLAFIIVSVVVLFHLMMAICLEAALSLYEERMVRIKETPSMSSQQQQHQHHQQLQHYHLMMSPSGSKGEAVSDVVRLEQKLDDLTKMMNRLVERQVMMQDILLVAQMRQRNQEPEQWENEPRVN
jgi:voltage-gated sodium channel